MNQSQGEGDFKPSEYEAIYGVEAGPLAQALDELTDAMTVIGQHTVTCRALRTGEPPLDIQRALTGLQHAKIHIQASMQRIKAREQ